MSKLERLFPTSRLSAASRESLTSGPPDSEATDRYIDACQQICENLAATTGVAIAEIIHNIGDAESYIEDDLSARKN